MIISITRLREVLHYAPETGLFAWRIFKCATAMSGNRAGTVNTIGYRQIRVDGRIYYEHRLAWFYVYEEWPDGCIDHINRVRHDNRIANLRIATKGQNGVNVDWSSNNASGFRGVVFHTKAGKYVARLGRLQKYIGSYDTAEEAHKAYKRELIRRYGEFAPEAARRD